MTTKLFVTAATVAFAASLASVPALARDQIRIVGSSTVYPFTTTVAEQFARAGGGRAPIVESTGTGGGLKLFCAGVGVDFPDAANASRRINKNEFADCQKNGVKEIVELKVGFDGLTIANSKKGPDLKLTKEQVFRALAKQVPDASGKLVANPNRNWSDIDPSLPNQKIEVLGPPPTSGTRDSFLELVMEPGAEKIAALADLKKSDRKAFDAAWKSLREDGAYIDAGENDNLIVQKLDANPAAVGIFGYSFLEENAARIKGAAIEGVVPDFDAIAAGKYSVARPLFVYFKKQHIGVVPGLDKFIAEYVSDKALGENGYLGPKGLVTLPAQELSKVRADVQSMKPMTSEAGI